MITSDESSFISIQKTGTNSELAYFKVRIYQYMWQAPPIEAKQGPWLLISTT